MARLYHQFLQFLEEKREEHIRPEDQEARNKARARENAEEQHKKRLKEQQVDGGMRGNRTNWKKVQIIVKI